jgi:hypothetical protein
LQRFKNAISSTFKCLSRFQQILFAVFLILAGIGFWWGYKKLKQSKQPATKAISLVPDSCLVLMSFDDYPEFSNSLRNKNLLWQDLQKMTGFNDAEKYFAVFDSLLAGEEFFRELAADNPVYVAVYPKQQFIISCNLKELGDEKNFAELVSTGKTKWIQLNMKLQRGVIGISNSNRLLEKMYDPSTKRLADNKHFASLKNSVSYSGFNLYLASNKQFEFLSGSYSNISIRPERIILNGIQAESVPGVIAAFDAPSLQNTDFFSRIPLLCNSFRAFAVGNAEKLFGGEEENNWWNSVDENAMFNARSQFYGNMEGLMADVLMPSGKHAVVIQVKDSARLAELVPFMSDSAASAGRVVSLKMSASFAQSTFKGVGLKDLSLMALFKDYAVFAATQNDAEIFVNAAANNSSIMDNRRFRQFISKNFDPEFHYMDYRLLNSLTLENVPMHGFLYEEDLEALKNVGHCSYVAVKKNNRIDFRFNLSYSQENFNDEPGILWTMNADTGLVTRPYLFKNHTTNGNELVYQDGNNDLYLQSVTGKMIWKKKTGEPVESEIFTVDAFRNGKFQMLFSTTNYLHLIDRNGNYVQGYPVKLPAKATSGLTVLDYENKNELRLFIACADKKIYNYSIYGVKQEGFKPLATISEVELPVKYCKVGLSDYLVTADKKGKIYAFSRKGDGRIDFKNKLIEDAENFEIEQGNLLSNSHIVYYDTKERLINKVSLADKKEAYKTPEIEDTPAICFGDFDHNNTTDILLASGMKLEAYNFNGTRIFATDAAGSLKPSRLSFFRNGNRTFICSWDSGSGIAGIYDVEEKSSREYKASRPALICDLFNDGKTYLLIVNGSEIKCLKL